MLRLQAIRAPLGFTPENCRRLAAEKLRVPPGEILEAALVRKSVDARDKGDVHFVLTLDVTLRSEAAVLRKKPKGIEQVTPPVLPPVPKPAFRQRPVVVGAGPAGLFAALVLARSGAQPILIERGQPVERRMADVERLRADGVLDPESNVQFGEGGAGTFSDGKLTTGIKSPWNRFVLQTFAEHGAAPDICYEHKPHIGTDVLRQVIVSMRAEILRLGGTVRFGTRAEALLLRGQTVTGLRCRCGEEIFELLTDTVLLAIGHSARDTVKALFDQGLVMEQKPFAVGVRIEHPQVLIDRAQYGRFAGHPALGAAPYKLNVPTPDGRGAYTFCMCPGGEVIAAASEAGGVAVNGMSNRARDAVNANAAVLVGIRPEDFGDAHPLSGFRFQRGIEEAAFRCGGGAFRAPAQRVEDLLAGRETAALGEVTPSYRPGVTPGDLRACLPAFVIEDLRLGIRSMDRQLHGFAHPDAVLTGVETRSSSPVRILRGADGMAALDGLFPVGEGAGYAGGIVSAAVDGIRAAVAAIERSYSN